MAWEEPITDRTAEDVEYRRKKAYCNARDLNRLEGNSGILGVLFGLQLNIRTWRREDFPTVGELNRILENIEALRTAYYTRQDTPATPQMPLTTWEKWNVAETILRDLYQIWRQNEEVALRTGESWSGEGIGVI